MKVFLSEEELRIIQASLEITRKQYGQDALLQKHNGGHENLIRQFEKQVQETRDLELKLSRYTGM